MNMEADSTGEVNDTTAQTQESSGQVADPGVNSNVDVNTGQTQVSEQGAENQPQYVDQNTLNESYRSLQGLVDKKYGEVNTQLSQFGQTMQALQPLAEALNQSQQSSEPDPVAINPMEALRNLVNEVNQLKEQSSTQGQTISEVQAQFLGSLQSQMIDQNFEKEFGSRDDLVKVKNLAAGEHKDIFGALYTASGNDATKAFKNYTTLLKAGAFTGESQQVAGVVNALNRETQHGQMAYMSSLANPQGGVQESAGQPTARQVYDAGSFTFN